MSYVIIYRHKREQDRLPPSDDHSEFSPSASPDHIGRVPTIPQHLRTRKSHTVPGQRKRSQSKRDFDQELDKGLDEMNAEMGLMSPRDIFLPADDDYLELLDHSANTGAKKVVSSRSKDPKLSTIPADVLAGIQVLRNVRIMTEQWASGLGSVEEWPRIFQEQYDVACERPSGRTTQEEVDEFLKSVEKHVNDGKAIELRKSPVVRPPSSHEAWGDYLAAGDLMDMLYRGIITLELRLDIVAPRGPHPSDADSSIRRWKGLVEEY